MKPSHDPKLEAAIGVQTYSWIDQERNRPVTVELWYPAQDVPEAKGTSVEDVWVHPQELRDAPFAKATNRLPLIVMSHGHGGDRRDRSWLAERLVKNGYLVASIDHHGNTWQTLSAEATLRFWERPQDVSFALDRLLSEPKLQERIDEKRIGFVGYSLGGLTGLSLAGGIPEGVETELERQTSQLPDVTPELLAHMDFSPARRSYYEPRIKAVFLMAPATWCFVKEKALQALKTPLAIVATLSDEVLAFREHMQPLILRAVPARLKILRKGETHFVFLNLASEKGKALLGERVVRDPPGIDRKESHREIGSFALDFFNHFLRSVR